MRWVCAACLGLALAVRPAAGQTDPHTFAYSQVRLEAEADHLARIGAWGGASLIGGTLGALMASTPELRGYGIQTAVWGAATLAVVGMALDVRDATPPTTMEMEHAAEARLDRLLRLNLVVSAAAVGAGAAIVATAPAGSRGAAQRGHGASVATQGVVLLALDGIAYAASRRRQAALSDAVALRASGTSLSVVVSW